MAKLFLAIPLFVLVLTSVWGDVQFTITNAAGEKDVGKTYNDIKEIIMQKYGSIMAKDGVLPKFSEANKVALEDPRFKELSDKVQKGEDLTAAEDEEFVKLHFKYFGSIIIDEYKEENLKFEYEES